MQDLLMKNVLQITGGELITGKDDIVCDDFSKDSRTINEGEIFVGIQKETFNGNLFWKEALNKGAKAVIVEGIDFDEKEIKQYKNKTIVRVEDTIEAIGKIANYKRNQANIPVIAVTGSVGKTSTKDIIANILSMKYKTLKTEGNFNNDIGLPFTLLKLKEHQAVVLEMGMNHFKEIRKSTQIANPTISVITNIGTSHIGNLGSRENILKAKLEILDGMKTKSLIINNDNDLLNEFYNIPNDDIEITTIGIRKKSDIMAENIVLGERNSQFICKTKESSFQVNVPVGGEHFVYNALIGVAVGKKLNMSDSDIKRGIETFELTKSRMDIDLLSNGAKIINDSYNASLESMTAALKYLSEFKNCRKIAFLGDMFELGEYSEQLHRKVGEEVVENRIDILICAGKQAKFIAEEARFFKMKKENVFYFETKEEATEFLKQRMKPTDIILIKASNGMKFFDVVPKLFAL